MENIIKVSYKTDWDKNGYTINQTIRIITETPGQVFNDINNQIIQTLSTNKNTYIKDNLRTINFEYYGDFSLTTLTITQLRVIKAMLKEKRIKDNRNTFLIVEVSK